MFEIDVYCVHLLARWYMAEKMVRMQVYLSREIYDRLQRRAMRHGLTLAVQIRAALEDYIEHNSKRDEKEFEPLDLESLNESLEQIKASGEGAPDAAEKHDNYVYGDLHGETAPRREQPALAVRERRATYSARKRNPARPAARKRGKRR